MWDNLLTIILLNIVLLLFLGLLLLPLPLIGQLHPAFVVLYIIISLILFIMLFGITSGYTMEISDYKKPGIKAFISYFKLSWKYSIVQSFFTIILILIALFVIPYYFLRGTIIDLILCGIVFWTSITIVLALLYFLPVSLRLNKGIKKSIRNSFLLLFDNTLFSILSLSVSLFLLIISLFTIYLIPGLVTLTLWTNVCLKILLYKYDYIEANPDVNRKKIPWKELIIEDEKKVGKRTLRGMIFPWKE